MDQGGAAIFLAVRGPLCAAGDRDLPTVTQSWRGGSGAECQPRIPGKGAHSTRPLLAPLEVGGGS